MPLQNELEVGFPDLMVAAEFLRFQSASSDHCPDPASGHA
jgi:hypothetical protein